MPSLSQFTEKISRKMWTETHSYQLVVKYTRKYATKFHQNKSEWANAELCVWTIFSWCLLMTFYSQIISVFTTFYFDERTVVNSVSLLNWKQNVEQVFAFNPEDFIVKMPFLLLWWKLRITGFIKGRTSDWNATPVVILPREIILSNCWRQFATSPLKRGHYVAIFSVGLSSLYIICK